MKNLHLLLFGFGIMFSGIILVVMLGMDGLSWVKDYMLSLCLVSGMLVSLKAADSLIEMRQRLSQ